MSVCRLLDDETFLIEMIVYRVANLIGGSVEGRMLKDLDVRDELVEMQDGNVDDAWTHDCRD